MPRETLTPAVDYIRKHFAPQDALLAEIDATLVKIQQHINVGPDEGKLLQLLIKLHGVKSVVEVGTLAGYSAIWMARALPEDGHLYAINKEPEHVALADGFFARSDVGHKITQLQGDAHDALPTLDAKGPFDMIFIDADKISYPDYLDWAEKNIKKGGLIVGDNTFLFDTVWLDAPPPNEAPATWAAMRSFNERLADPKKYFSAIIPTLDGMTVALKLF